VSRLLAQPHVVGAIIGAATALLIALITNVWFAHRREVREQRRYVLEKRLTEFYSPLHYHIGVLVDLVTSTDSKRASVSSIQSLLEEAGYLCSSELRTALYRLASNEYDVELASEIFHLVRAETDRLTVEFESSHFLGSRTPKLPATSDR